MRGNRGRPLLLIDTLTEAVGTKEQSPEKGEEIRMIRKKAYGLLLFIYEEIRAGVLYVRRREGDADSIIPSLYAGRLGGARDGGGDAEPAEPAPAPSSPSESGVVSPVATDLTSSLDAAAPFKRS